MSKDDRPGPIDYLAAAPKNADAAVALAFGLFVIVPLAGLPAIYFGRRGSRVAEAGGGRGRIARAAIVLGTINLVWTVVAATVLSISISRARSNWERIACASNLRLVSEAIARYRNDHRGVVPLTFDALVAEGLLDPTLGGCAATGSVGNASPTLAAPRVSASYRVATPATRSQDLRYGNRFSVLVYEPLTNHGGRGINVVFADDGRVEWIDAPLAKQVVAELEAGQNPPPSLK